MELCHFTKSMKTSAFNGLWSHLLEERVKKNKRSEEGLGLNPYSTQNVSF
jgi:hypothetical protein